MNSYAKYVLGVALLLLFSYQAFGEEIYFLLNDMNAMTEGDIAQVEFFEDRGHTVSIWDGNTIQDDEALLGLTPTQWADAFDLVWIDESVSSARVTDLQDTTTPMINNENYACDILGILAPDGDDDHGSPGTLNDAGQFITSGTHFGTDLLIVDESHPIAVGAGLSDGPVTIYDDQGLGASGGGRMSWCTPNDEADIIALIPGFEKDFPMASPLFVHEAGDTLADGRIAPGMRIQLFLSDTNRGPAPVGDPRGGEDGTGPGWEATLLAPGGYAILESVVNYALGIEVGDPGDFNSDGSFGVADVDLLVAAIGAGNGDAQYDLNGDGAVNLSDVDSWLSMAGNAILGDGISFLPGDANLSGTVDAADLNEVGISWQMNRSTWSEGDFTADGMVDAEDLNIVGINWQRTAGEGAPGAAVPEPSSWGLVWLSAVGLLSWRRRQG